MKKLNNVLAVSVLAFGLAACGGDDVQPIHHNPNLNNNGVHIPNTPNTGFGADAAQRIVQDLQAQFGNLRTSGQSRLGNQTLSRGTHSWQTLYNMLDQAARNCMQELAHCNINMSWGGYQTVGGLSNVNFSVFMDYLDMGQVDNTDVIYDRYPHVVYTLAHPVDLLVSYMSSTYSQAWSSWGMGGYYPVYNMPYYGNDHLNIGFGYNNGNWGLSLGGGVNF